MSGDGRFRSIHQSIRILRLGNIIMHSSITIHAVPRCFMGAVIRQEVRMSIPAGWVTDGLERISHSARIRPGGSRHESGLSSLGDERPPMSHHLDLASFPVLHRATPPVSEA